MMNRFSSTSPTSPAPAIEESISSVVAEAIHASLQRQQTAHTLCTVMSNQTGAPKKFSSRETVITV